MVADHAHKTQGMEPLNMVADCAGIHTESLRDFGFGQAGADTRKLEDLTFAPRQQEHLWVSRSVREDEVSASYCAQGDDRPTCFQASQMVGQVTIRDPDSVCKLGKSDSRMPSNLPQDMLSAAVGHATFLADDPHGDKAYRVPDAEPGQVSCVDTSVPGTEQQRAGKG